jgi:holin-like protein
VRYLLRRLLPEVPMLRGLAVLLLFQLAGEVLTRAAAVPIPGPVAGMALLLLALGARPLGDELRAASSGLLSHLSLLFVPAGVGVMLHAPRLASEWVAVAVSLVLSTAATIAVTGWVAQRLARRGEAAEGARP